jgi:predicted O-methyltransferase YrrM
LTQNRPAYEQEERFLALWEIVQAYTMTGPERGYALWLAVNAVVDRDIDGAMVECGVWRGGSAMLIALTLMQRGVKNRPIYLFDTFCGMTQPGPRDRTRDGKHASYFLQGASGSAEAQQFKASAAKAEVLENMTSTGYDMRLVRFVAGDVCDTLPKTQTLQIALLRLDTDFYDSTYHELTQLYPRLRTGGMLIIDDYGHWLGAQEAVDAYFDSNEAGYQRPMFWPIDYTGIGAVKTEPLGKVEIERYDYLPEGLVSPSLLSLFPYAQAQSPWPVAWPYLRKSIPHIWRSDTRGSGAVTGNASVEEAAYLYTIAMQFKGKRGLEIGTHFGWTAAHLLSAGLQLDCIDPAFIDAQRLTDVAQVLDAITDAKDYTLWAGGSPSLVEQAFSAGSAPWSLAFIDGDHDGEAPAIDAAAVIPFLADDAVVIFHDLVSPHVADGLAVMQEADFSIRLIHTQQIIGVAWRGDVQLPQHRQDPNIPVVFPSHLLKFDG